MFTNSLQKRDRLLSKALDEFDISVILADLILLTLKEITRAILKMSKLSIGESLSFEDSLLKTAL